MAKDITNSMEDIKNIELSILKEIDKICRENDLIYSIKAGTALGAVRHHGFIPWDDDIDVMMLREDYNKFIEIIKEKQKDENYQYFILDNEYPFSKLIDRNTDAKEIGINKIKGYGLFVDIFPINKMPEDAKEASKYAKKINYKYKVFKIKLYGKQISNNKGRLFLKNILAFLYSFKSKEKALKEVNDLQEIYNDDNSIERYVDFSELIIGKGRIGRNKDFYQDVIDIDFENLKVKIIKDYHKYLTEIYGDYMKLPSVENRVSNHNWEYIRIK